MCPVVWHTVSCNFDLPASSAARLGSTLGPSLKVELCVPTNSRLNNCETGAFPRLRCKIPTVSLGPTLTLVGEILNLLETNL